MSEQTLKGQLITKPDINKITQEMIDENPNLIPTGKFSFFLSSKKIKQKINEVIGGKDGQAFITNICSAVANNPDLAKCENWSIVLAALQGGALKLSPQLQQFYLVPFNDRSKTLKQAQFQIGYKGYIQLAIRSGQYKNINVIVLKQGEVLSYNPLTEELKTKFIEDEEVREKTPSIGYYAELELLNGFKKSMYWTKKKMELHAKKYSKLYQTYPAKSLWFKDFDIMAQKTMLRQLISKWGVMSVDMQEAYLKDQSVIKQNGDYDYIDSPDSEEQPENEQLENEQENQSLKKLEPIEEKDIEQFEI